MANKLKVQTGLDLACDGEFDITSVSISISDLKEMYEQLEGFEFEARKHKFNQPITTRMIAEELYRFLRLFEPDLKYPTSVRELVNLKSKLECLAVSLKLILLALYDRDNVRLIVRDDMEGINEGIYFPTDEGQNL